MASGVVGSSKFLGHSLHFLKELIPIFANLLIVRMNVAIADLILQRSLLVLYLAQRALCHCSPSALVIKLSFKSQTPVVGFRRKPLSVRCHTLGPLSTGFGIWRICLSLTLRLLRTLSTTAHVGQF